MSLDPIRQRFEIPGVVRIDEGQGGLPRLSVTSDRASAEFYLHGAHLTQFQPRGSKPVLFVSAQSNFDATKPIRGGVPVIFPWFGPRAGVPEAPLHGIVRVRSWQLETCEVQGDGEVRVVFSLHSDPATLQHWPSDFGLKMAFSVGRSLEMTLEVRADRAPITFEEAFHTYFSVGDVRQVRVEGLENTDYVDKVDAFRRKTQPAEPVVIAGETDRVYLNTTSASVIRDPVLERTITVEKEHSATTVVWNPWIAKAKAMADFGDDEWPQMLCVETANAGDAAIRLDAGQTHSLRTRIRVSS